ncbi:adhesion G-protein coupled receptor V1 isoform X2 [Nematostella vectensis]|uniref:adhesion G-protein coupled receptor V1 isoform X2 n=1 Tax=Nematostella vectensis TaxID=45351 RepID=UPI0020778FCC|nr:adhesion G-protein coupled receptor V1 isoform X2 [Nematostella vectensis]
MRFITELVAMGIRKRNMLVVVTCVILLNSVLGDGSTNGFFSFTNPEYVISEGSRASLDIRRTGGTNGIVYVLCKLVNGTTLDDFGNKEVIRKFTDGMTSDSCDFETVDDAIPEGNETYTIQLSIMAGAGEIRDPSSTKITILANDKGFGVIGFSESGEVSVSEGAASPVSLKLIRALGSFGPVSVDWKVSSGPSLGTDDFITTSGTVSFQDGQIEANLVLNIKSDDVPENDEVFTVKLATANGGAELNASYTELQVKILANDAPVRFPITSLSVPENATRVDIEVFRGLQSDGQTVVGSIQDTVTVNWYVIPGNAQPGQDFKDINGTLTFASGVTKQSISVLLINDVIPELAENFSVQLQTLSSSVYLVPPGIAMVTILPNDDQHGVISFGGFQRIIDEDGSRTGHFNVTRGSGTFGSVTVDWKIFPQSPSDLANVFESQTGHLTFLADEKQKSFTVTVKADVLPEEAKEYYVELYNVSGGARLGNTQADQKAVFYVADSDMAYGEVTFASQDMQRILKDSNPRKLQLSLVRSGGTLQTVLVNYTAEYYLPGSSTPSNSLGLTSPGSVTFNPGQSSVVFTIDIANNGFISLASVFKVTLEDVSLAGVSPLIAPKTPSIGDNNTLFINVTAGNANGEVGFSTSHQSLVVQEPEGSLPRAVILPVLRDGTAGEANVTWTLSSTNPLVTAGDTRPTSGVITFQQGQSLANLTIEVMPDDVPELDEALTVKLTSVTSPNRLQSGMETAQITIPKNDNPGGTFNFESVDTLFVKERDAIELLVIRLGASLDKRCVTLKTNPSGDDDFSGARTLTFYAGDTKKSELWFVKEDGEPELEEFFQVSLTSGGRGCEGGTLGNETKRNISVAKSDDPHGIVGFAPEDLIKQVNESQVSPNIVKFNVQRLKGTFGTITVTWEAFSTSGDNASLDISPVSGQLTFAENVSGKTLDINIIHEMIPEAKESFTITLTNVTGGAKFNNYRSANLSITKNDDPVYIGQPTHINITEGQPANFTIRRGGDGDTEIVVTYSTVDGTATASSADYKAVAFGRVTMGVGEFSKEISIPTIDDELPEGVEEFTVQIVNATGDTVLYPTPVGKVSIYASDAGTGLFEFSLASRNKTSQEGASVSFAVSRSIAQHGEVHVYWQIYHVLSNGSLVKLLPGQDFEQVSGYTVFRDSISSQEINVQSLQENVAELDELFAVEIINATGIGTGENGRLGNATIAYLTITANDDPNGVFLFASLSRDVTIPEDFLPGFQDTTTKNLTVLRSQGTWGDVQVLWEISTAVQNIKLPATYDLLFLGTKGSGVVLDSSKRRQYTGTDVACFSSARTDSSVSVKHITGLSSDTSLSVWLQPERDSYGVFLSYGTDASVSYSAAVNTSGVTSTLTFNYLANSTVVDFGKSIADGTWHFLVITITSSKAIFYIDGVELASWVLPSGSLASNGMFTIGSKQTGQSFTGCAQDVRVYGAILEDSLVSAKAEPVNRLRPINGYINYAEYESTKMVAISTVDNLQPEPDTIFSVGLLTTKGGARLDLNNAVARLTVSKSDNANGLFLFDSITPISVNESTNITLVVRRDEGDSGTVTVRWGVYLGAELATQDFLEYTGNIVFNKGIKRMDLNLHLNNDNHPELNEAFQLKLLSAVADGKVGSTPTSGASLKPNFTEITITITENDYPYGLIQFAETEPDANSTIMIATQPYSKDIRESVGTLVLYVVRAQGTEGEVTVPWRIDPGTASSPSDYVDDAGEVTFAPGVKSASISIQIKDDHLPELNKTFTVALYSPRNGAVLNPIASTAVIDILPSDDAFGVMNFTAESLTRTVQEDSLVTLTVVRAGGTLGSVTLYWAASGQGSQDIQPVDGYVSLSTGQTSASIDIRINQDSVSELAESTIIELFNTTRGRLASTGTKCNLTILPSDDPYGVFKFTPSTLTTQEGNKTVSLTITRSLGTKGAIRVHYQTLGAGDSIGEARQNAVPGQDFVAVDAYVDFADGQTNASVFVDILDDVAPEDVEKVLVNLTWLELRQHAPVIPVPTDSPRLGSSPFAVITIEPNDDASGVLQLSSSRVTVKEPYDGTILNVTRTAGAFGEVTVYISVVDGNTTSADYTLLEKNVTLLSGERSKAVPIQIVNDDIPEHAETFTIKLLSAGILGGARLGSPVECVVTIDENDYPYGLIGFSSASLNQQAVEPASGVTRFVTFTVERRFGTELTSTVHWEATIHGALASADVTPTSGDLVFPVEETQKAITLQILADDTPEIPEVVKVNLTGVVSGRAVLDTQTNVANLTIAANDNPHGVVRFTQPSYNAIEGPEQITVVHLPITRDFGTFGDVKVYYSTLAGSGPTSAEPGIDFTPVSNNSVVLPHGQANGNITIQILNDSLPELGETFMVFIERVELIGQNSGFPPVIGSPRTVNVTIVTNDDAHGLFVIEAVSPDPGSGGTRQTILEQEAPVTFVVRRLAGTIGRVTVEWKIYSHSTANRSDFTGDGAVFVFEQGDTSKTGNIRILDDSTPERDETVVIVLVNPTGGSRVASGLGNNLTVIISANDGVAGQVGFSQSSQSVVAKEGTTVDLSVERTAPAAGKVSVNWVIVGTNASHDFSPHMGHAVFLEGQRYANITFNVEADSKPEPDEVFSVQLSNVTTVDVAASGAATLIPARATATVTVQASDEPHGCVEFQSGSRIVITTEDKNVTLILSRLYGTLGDLRIHYEIKSGNNTQLDQQTTLATAGEDFIATVGSVMIPNEQAVGEIPVFIIDESVPEQSEVFIVNLTAIELVNGPYNVTGAPPKILADSVAQVTISPNDDPAGVIGFSQTRIDVNESIGAFNVTVLRSQGSLGTVTVKYFIKLTSTAIPNDYSIPSFGGGEETLTFVDGQREQNIEVKITDDTIPEDNESIILGLKPGVGAALVPGHEQTEIVILYNDDARGVFNFSSDSTHKVISEPGNGALNEAVFRVVRNVDSFGSVVVGWRVVNASASADLSPVNGTLVFGKGVDQMPFSIKSLVDSDSEKAENFGVEIYIISGGGRISSPHMATLTISENDYPYGELEIISSLTQSGTVSVEESVGFVKTKIVRKKGNLGRITVDYQTIPGSASSGVGDAAFFEQIQGIQAAGANAFYAFSAYGDDFLVLGANGNGSQNGYRGSTLFRWQGVYIPIQEIKTNGAVRFDSIVINGMTYLAVANQGSIGDYEVNSSVFALSSDGKLSLVQDLPSQGASSVSFFAQGGQTYLVISNGINNAGTTLLKTKVYKWVTDKFVDQAADIDTRAASDLASFSINGVMMMAISFKNDLDVSNLKTKSPILRWQTGSFIPYREVDTVGPIGVEHFAFGGEYYLLFANSKGPSKVYQWKNSNFDEVQSLETNAVKSARVYHSNGKPNLVTVESHDALKIYSWNTSISAFTLSMNTTIAGVVSVEPVVIADPVAGEVAMMMAAVKGTSSSPIYIPVKLSSSADYVPRKGQVTLMDGQTELELDFTVLPDSLPEKDETFDIIIYNTTNKAVLGSTSRVTVTILSSDNPHGRISFAINSTRVVQPELATDTTVNFEVVREYGSFGRVVVAWNMTGNYSDGDLKPLSGQVMFQEGETRKIISVLVHRDDLPELDEVAVIRLVRLLETGSSQDGRGAVINTARSTAILIIPGNDDPHGVISWSRPVYLSQEPSLTNSSLILTIHRRGGTMGVVLVSYQTVRAIQGEYNNDQVAVPGVDYVTKTGQAVIQDGANSTSVSVDVIHGSTSAFNKLFLVNLMSAVLQAGSASTPHVTNSPRIDPSAQKAVVVIAQVNQTLGEINFDVTVDANTNAVMTTEGTQLSLKVVRNGSTQHRVGFSYVVQPSRDSRYAPASDSDISPLNGTVYFESGETEKLLSITIIQDNTPELDEAFYVLMSRPIDGIRIGPRNRVDVVVSASDSPYGVFGISTYNTINTVEEGSILRLEVQRLGGDFGDVTITWRITPGNSQIHPVNGTLLFLQGSRSMFIEVAATNDSIPEGAQQFTLELVSADNGANLNSTASRAQIVILANDNAKGVISVDMTTRAIVTGEPMTSGYDGVFTIRVLRSIGQFGEAFVSWDITKVTASAADPSNAFNVSSGRLRFTDGVPSLAIPIQVKQDTEPEEFASYVFKITNAENADRDPSPGALQASIDVVASDDPYGVLVFEPPYVYNVSEDVGTVNMTVKRNKGDIGRLSANYSVTSSSAMPGQDYEAMSGVLEFADKEQTKKLTLKVLQDVSPELDETILVQLQSVRLLDRTLNFSTVQGLQLNMPPRIGDQSAVSVTLLKNDEAHGIVQFVVTSATVRESDGHVSLGLQRTGGTFGIIQVNYNVLNGTANHGEDYNVSSGVIIFKAGQYSAQLIVGIIDDVIPEQAETFSVQLISVTGGGRLGTKVTAQVQIETSDNPSGLFGFVNATDLQLVNPNITRTLNFGVDRVGGAQGIVQVKWQVLRVSLPSSALSDDFIGATDGVLSFASGDKTRQFITIKLDAYTGPEPEEVFVLNLYDATGGAAIDTLQTNITLTVLKQGNPNGIFGFQSTASKIIQEPGNAQVTSLQFPVERTKGTIGSVQVYWRVIGLNTGAISSDLESSSGTLDFLAGQQLRNLEISVRADDLPELEEQFLITLYRVDGGGDLDFSKQNVTFNISANDAPHGVFRLKPAAQSLTVSGDGSRHLRFTILRENGTFGSVQVSYTITYSAWYPESIAGKLTVPAGDPNREVSEDITLTNTAFLESGSSFRILLTEVGQIGVSSGIPPILASSSPITETVSVPESAANAVFRIADSSTRLFVDSGNNVRAVTIRREGLYGDVIVNWRKVDPVDSLGAGFSAGNMAPSSGQLTFTGATKELNFSLQAIPVPSPDSKLIYAVELASATTSSAVAGGANITQGNGKTAIIEYSGRVEFAPDSLQLSVEEGGQVTCRVVRLFSALGSVTFTYTALGSSRSVRLEEGEYTKTFQVTVPDNNTPEKDSSFNINITSVFGANFPRLGTKLSATVTVQDNDDASGVISFKTTSMRMPENATSGNTRVVTLEVQRTRGTLGEVSVLVRSVGGGEGWTSSASPQSLRDQLSQRSQDNNATVGNDYVQLYQIVRFPSAYPTPAGGQTQTVQLTVIDDDLPEPDEQVYLFLSNVTGGARLATNSDNLQTWSVVTIEGNDLMNGEVGFVAGSQAATIDEDGLASATLKVERIGATFGTALVLWHVREAEKRPELVAAEGTITFSPGVREVDLVIRLNQDNTPEFQYEFHVDLVQLLNTQQARIKPSARSAVITVLPSDYPYGLVGFAPAALYTAVNLETTEVSLDVVRSQGNTTDVTVTYQTQMLPASSNEAGVSTAQAVVGRDYQRPVSLSVRFKPGETTQRVKVALTPETPSASQYPKAFRIVILNASSQAIVNGAQSKAMVIISNNKETTQLLKLRAASKISPLTDENINQILADLKNSVRRPPLNNDQLTLTKDTINEILDDKKTRPTASEQRLQEITKATLMDIFDELLDPARSDTKGRSDLAQVFEHFSFALAYGQPCPTSSLGLKGKRAYCDVYKRAHSSLNGLQIKSVTGKHYFTYPSNLYPVPISSAEPVECGEAHFIEYHNSHWFTGSVVNSKVLSTSVNDSSALNKNKEPFTYVIYSGNKRVTPMGAKCVFWDFDKSVWSTSGCMVKSDEKDFVECQCTHMSNYAAQGQSDDRVGYTTYFYAACFVCLGAFALALLSHLACSVENLFSAKLLMHMFFACMIAQLMYVIGAYVSSTQAVVNESPAVRCSVLGVFIHYFYLCQFSWMFVQGWNLWRILVLNDEHTDRKYVLFFLLGWGMPVVVIVLYIVVAQAAFSWPFTDMYGDVHQNGDMCFIPNAYAALASAVAPVLLFLMGVAVVFTQAYQVTMQWRYYDDIYRGHYNIKEVRHVIALFVFVTITWLFAGLHLAYGYLWMIIVFAILDILLGLYVFILYFILRNQVRGVFKQTYAFQGEPPPIQTHDDFFRAQQNSLDHSTINSKRLKPRMSPDDPVDWDELDMGATPRSNRKLIVNMDDSNSIGRVNETYEDDIETDDFDDLIFALKTGGNFDDYTRDEKDPDFDLGHGDEHYEMRRISIADTHL